jgi:hypothetical protein
MRYTKSKRVYLKIFVPHAYTPFPYFFLTTCHIFSLPTLTLQWLILKVTKSRVYYSNNKTTEKNASELFQHKSRDSSASIVMDYGLDDLGSIGGSARFFSSTQHPSRATLGPIQPPIQWILGALSLGLKQLGHEADHSPPIYCRGQERWSYTSTPPFVFMAQCLTN